MTWQVLQYPGKQWKILLYGRRLKSLANGRFLGELFCPFLLNSIYDSWLRFIPLHPYQAKQLELKTVEHVKLLLNFCLAQYPSWLLRHLQDLEAAQRRAERRVKRERHVYHLANAFVVDEDKNEAGDLNDKQVREIWNYYYTPFQVSSPYYKREHIFRLGNYQHLHRPQKLWN